MRGPPSRYRTGRSVKHPQDCQKWYTCIHNVSSKSVQRLRPSRRQYILPCYEQRSEIIPFIISWKVLGTRPFRQWSAVSIWSFPGLWTPNSWCKLTDIILAQWINCRWTGAIWKSHWWRPEFPWLEIVSQIWKRCLTLSRSGHIQTVMRFWLDRERHPWAKALGGHVLVGWFTGMDRITHWWVWRSKVLFDKKG